MNKTIIAGLALLLLVIGIIFFMATPAASLSQDEAVQAVIAAHPELAAYQTTSLPPSSIETKDTPDGWHVAFIQSGSGLPGILHAECYRALSKSDIQAMGQYNRASGEEAQSIDLATCTPVLTDSSTTTPPQPASEDAVLPYGNVTLKLGEVAQFKDISIRPLSIEEDSRCPVDVQCIQAGTVRIKVQVVSGMGTSPSILTLGKVFTTEGEVITLTEAKPDKNSKTTITSSDYRLTFSVMPQGTPVANNPSGECYVGGCSAQLCSAEPDAVSTCEYTASYGCYKTATCERQTSGQCGWTPTPELTACLASN